MCAVLFGGSGEYRICCFLFIFGVFFFFVVGNFEVRNCCGYDRILFGEHENMCGREILIGSRDISDRIFSSALTAYTQQDFVYRVFDLAKFSDSSTLGVFCGGEAIDIVVDKIASSGPVHTSGIMPPQLGTG